MSVLIVVWSNGQALRWSLFRHILQTVWPQPKLMGFLIVSSKVWVQIGQERKSVHCGACTGIVLELQFTHTHTKSKAKIPLESKSLKKFFFFFNIFCKYSQHIVWNITWKTKKENDCLPLLYILTPLPITFYTTFISTQSTFFAFWQNQSHNKTASLIPSF